MKERDWDNYRTAMGQDSDGYECKRLNPELSSQELDRSTALKKQALEYMDNNQFILAIQVLNLAIDIRGVTENHLASLYLSRAKCWLRWGELQNCKLEEYVKYAKRDADRALCIRPCYCENWSVMAQCFFKLGRNKKALYFHQMAVSLKCSNQQLKKSIALAKETFDRECKIKQVDNTIDPEQLLRLSTQCANGLMNKSQTDQLMCLTTTEAKEYVTIMRGVELDCSKTKRDHYETNLQEWSLDKEHQYFKSQYNPTKAGTIYASSISNKHSTFAEPYNGLADILMADQSIRSDSIEKAKQLYEIASSLKCTNSNGYRLNYGVAESCISLARLVISRDPLKAESYLFRYVLFTALFELGSMYLKEGTYEQCELSSVKQDIDKAILFLTMASYAGSPESSSVLYQHYLMTTGEESPLTLDWKSRMDHPQQLVLEVPVTFHSTGTKQKKDSKEIKVIKTFRKLLNQDNKKPLPINKKYNQFETSYPPQSQTGVAINQYKVVGQASFDYDDPNDFSSIMRKMMGGSIPTMYPKCVLEGTLMEEPLVTKDHIEILLNDVSNFPVRASVMNADPTKYIVGTKYSLVGIQTHNSEWDGANIHSGEWVIKGNYSSSSCRNCSKIGKIKCNVSENCTAKYCTPVCQNLDSENGHNLICGLKSIKQRFDEMK